ncbi:MAG: TrkA family potassium uptake protein [Spirochaetaceae bacterium]|jgi:trk system potassium uptake protein TrkA|nr:TrkA family potassium uptake protein [Spirochaetaceae bacterium]
MKQIAILGLGHFGKSVLEELLELNVEVLILDKDKEVIDGYKDSSAHGVILNILTVETLRKALPESIDAVVIDTGKRIEASILAASYCAKRHIKTIIAKAETESHAEILELVGATKVVFPNREAAKRVTRQIISSALLNYIPIGADLVIAEMEIPPDLVGKRLADSHLREKYGLNLLSIRNGGDGEFLSCGPDYVFKTQDIGLFFGADHAVNRFTDDLSADEDHKNIISKLFALGASRFFALRKGRASP